MSVPDATISFLLENLNQAIQHDIKLIAGEKESAQGMKQQLENLKGFVPDFSKYTHESEALKSLVKAIRILVFEAEDVIDTFIFQAAVQKGRNWVSKNFHKYTDYPKKLLEVGEEMEKISKKIDKLKQTDIFNGIAMKATLPDLPAEDSSSKEEPIVEEEHVIGFDDAAKRVRELLTEGTKKLEIVSIVGMLGLGKTTLAKMVFKDPTVDFEFMIQAFVYVSKEYKKAEVLLKILASFTHISDEVKKMGERELENHVYKELQGKQYLIVLDDVWEKVDWDCFKGAFPKNDKRCRVLITTRNDYVAEHANPESTPYRLQLLSKDKSRELLRWRVFKDDKDRIEFLDYELTITKKCNGLPLAIVVVAGIILNDPTNSDWWSTVANSTDITSGSTETTKLIEYMYKHLPNELKLCFLYLGVFREDFEIPVWKLLRLWIAEGLIQQERKFIMDKEARGEQYLEELARRNLVIVGQRRSNGKIKTCRMHDTLREFCKNEATEENVFQEIRKDNLGHFLSGDASLEVNRRLCINNINPLNYISEKPIGGKRVRSFLTFFRDEKEESKFVNSIPNTFKLLRVLEVETLIFTKFPAPICSLVLLKYIAISFQLETLPLAMSALWNLQTLIVNTTMPTLDIKFDIWQMPQFRHLHTNASTKLQSPSSGCTNQGPVQQILTLSTISPESCTSEVLERVPHVKKLGIRGKIAKGSNFFGYLRSLSSVKNLKLLNDEVRYKLCDQSLEKIFPKHLTKLTLLNTFLEWEEMSMLAELEKLEVLKLKDYAFEGKFWKNGKGRFPCLKHLHVGRTDLADWDVSVDQFPQLRSLKLNGCDELLAFPQGFKDIPSLRSVNIHSTNRDVAATAIKILILKLQQERRDPKISPFTLTIFPPYDPYQ